MGKLEGRDRLTVLGKTHEARGSTRPYAVPLEQRGDMRTVGVNATQLSEGGGSAVAGLRRRRRKAGARGAELADSCVDVGHLAEDAHGRAEAATLERVARGKRGRGALEGFVQRVDEHATGSAVPDMETGMPQAPA